MTRVLDYTVKSKHCASCSHWEGGACAMEPSESDQQVKNLDCVSHEEKAIYARLGSRKLLAKCLGGLHTER